MRVKTKIDLWVHILLWAVMAGMPTAIVLLPQGQRSFGWPLSAVVLIIVAWVYFGTYYELKGDCLRCRCGPFYENIPYIRIKSVRLCDSLASSFALSRRCIEITQHGKGFISGTTYISPRNRDAFAQQLTQRCPNLMQPGE